MKEKLIIKNFGPIKSVELELGRFTVLIGEQATGKSTIAKLLAICRYFSYVVNYGFEGNSFEEGLIAWGIHDFVQRDTFIQYECRHYILTVENVVRNIEETDVEGDHFEYEEIMLYSKMRSNSEEFTNLLSELEKIKPKKDKLSTALLDWRIPTSFFQNDVARVMDNPFYLQAERGLQSIFSLGRSSIQNMSDSFFNQLAVIDRVARLFRDDTNIEPLGIVYKNIEGHGYIRKNTDNEFYDLSNAATGYQSTIPVVLLVKYYSEIKRKSKTFIIEEPEENLFPTAQYELIKYLVAAANNYNNSILFTTHSPYVLASLNNLMYAYTVGQMKDAKTNSIIDKKYWVNPEIITVYRLTPGGESESIIDREMQQIKAEIIDEVSRELNKQWDGLFNIESEGSNED